MSHEHSLFEGQISNQKIAEKSRKHLLRYDIDTTLQKKTREIMLFLENQWEDHQLEDH